MSDKLFNFMAARVAKIGAAKPWEPLPAVEPSISCLCCGAGRDKSGEDFLIAVGFGSSGVSANGRHIIDEQEWIESDAFDGGEVTLALVERLAATRPDVDWRITMFGPLSGQEYQRQGDGHWVLVHRDQGFA